MNVRIFHTIAAEGRISMEVYARELSAGLERVQEGNLEIRHCFPRALLRGLAGGSGPLARTAGYIDRYALYQWQARGGAADVNHIIEHGYGHLAFSLVPSRTVVTFHDAMLLKLRAHELRTEAYPWFTMLGHSLSLAAIRRVARVIADSESARSDFLRFTNYPPERVRVISLAVSERFQRCRLPPSQSADKAPDRPFRILHVGHCGPYKNIEGILKAISLLRQRLGQQVLFLKAGGGFTKSQLGLIDRLHLEAQVRHLGIVPEDELPRIYAEADLLVMPSLYEGFGLPALEAMACGTPVIASARGSLPEVVGDAAISVEPEDIEAIASALAEVLTNASLQAKLRRRGYERASAFSWDRTAKETLAVYREVWEENR